MPRGHNTLLAELRSLVAAIEVSSRSGDSTALKTHLRKLLNWGRELILRTPSSASGLTEQNESLRRRLRASKTSFDSMITAYKAILDAFETFRGTVDLVQQTKRLEDLPQTLDAIRKLRHLHTLNVILDQDLFESRIPDGVGKSPAATIRDRVRQFSPPRTRHAFFWAKSGISTTRATFSAWTRTRRRAPASSSPSDTNTCTPESSAWWRPTTPIPTATPRTRPRIS